MNPTQVLLTLPLRNKYIYSFGYETVLKLFIQEYFETAIYFSRFAKYL